MVKLKEVIGNDLSRKIESVFLNVDGYMSNFIASIEFNKIGPFKFKEELKRYINYQNSENRDFKITLESKSNLNHEIRVTIWRTISGKVPDVHYDLNQLYIFYYVDIFHNRGWTFNYDNIIITDKNGEILEDIS